MYIEYTQLKNAMAPPFQLSQADSRPMYQQIVDNIKQLILAGHWSVAQGLPSIRELAVSVRVSVITVKRAYQELEREGVIVTRQGMGSFVAAHTSTVADLKHAELMASVDRTIELADLLNMNKLELLEKVAQQFDERHVGEAGPHD